MQTLGRILSLATLVVVACGAAAYGQADDPFYKGLQDRGLRSLMEAYLKGKAGAAPAPGPQTPGGQPAGGAAAAAAAADATSSKLALAALEVQKALATQKIADRLAAFQSARKLYEEGIEEANKAVSAIRTDKTEERIRARVGVIKIRMALAKMIFEMWLKNDLEFLEITDLRYGDRVRATELLKAGADQYRAVLDDINAWRSSLDQLSQGDRLKLIAAGLERQITTIEREAKYSNAWINYYYGWILPGDYKPKDKKDRDRKQVLDDAITAFKAYVDLPDRISAKWYAHMVIGMSFREMGKFTEAMQELALASNTAAPDSLKIQIAFEKARTQVRQGKFAEARATVDETEKLFKGKADAQGRDLLSGSLYGLSLPIVRAEALILDGQKSGNAGMKDEGVKILQSIHTKGDPWSQIVQGIMDPLLGTSAVATAVKPEDIEKMDPFQMWLKANDLMGKAQDKKSPADMKLAADLYKAYVAKVGAKDPNYAAALYSRAACLLQLNQKAEAAVLFRQVADEAPTYKYAKDAAKYAVAVRGEVCQTTPTDPNMSAYEEALKWFCSKHLEADPDQQYYLGLIQLRMKKYIEAADSFSRVAEKTEHYPESRYWAPVCRLENLRENILPGRDKALILTSARSVVKDLLGYTEFALVKGASYPKEKAQQLRDWAQTTSINAAEVYLLPEVALPAEAVPILANIEAKFEPLADDTRGRVLALRIDALQKTGKLEEAQKELEKFLTVAKQQDVGPVLRGLFRAMTDDVRGLITRGQKKEAGEKVEQAKMLGDRLRDWLAKSTVAEKAAQIENNRYDLAELYLAVGNFAGALTIYQEIGGAKPWDVKKGDLLKEDCVYGMARAYEGLGETAPDAAQAKPFYETSLEGWRVLVDVSGANRDKQTQWERRYHQFYIKLKLGEKKEVAEALTALRIMIQPEPLGGKDPILQQKFLALLSQASQG